MNPMLTIAVRAARKAGDIITRQVDRLENISVAVKGQNDFVTEVDQAAEQAIIETLRRTYPNHAILAEESGAHGKEDEFEWIIDPLDGTTNFVHGFPQFAVSIALKHRGQLEHGVIYDPMRQELFTASRGGGTQLNGRRVRVSGRNSLEGALLGTGFPYDNHTRLDTYLEMFRALLLKTAGLRRPGSAALDLAYVASGRTDGFWEMDLKPWDMAAGALMIREAGGIVTSFNSGPDFLETGDIIAGSPKVHAAIDKIIQPILRRERLKQQAASKD